MDGRLTRRAVDVNWRNRALGHDVFEAEGATFVRNGALPDIYDANFIFGMTASEPAEIDRLLARAVQEYAHAARVTFHVGPFTPPSFEARLALEGYERGDAIVLLLEGPLRGQARQLEIRPTEDEETWRAYTELKRLNWSEYMARTNADPEDEGIGDELASANRLKCPPVRYVLAYEESRPVGFCSAWEGVDGMGQVEDLFVHPTYRHRGIATALIHHCVATARTHGAGPMVIAADPTDTPKYMYAALGWQPVAICRQYGKKDGT